MDRFAITFNDYTRFVIKSSNQSCDYCIRPASKQVILVSMKTVQVCRFNNGFYCCDEACNEWSFPDGTCILHGRIPKYTQGYARIIREVISEVMSDDSDNDD